MDSSSNVSYTYRTKDKRILPNHILLRIITIVKDPLNTACRTDSVYGAILCCYGKMFPNCFLVSIYLFWIWRKAVISRVSASRNNVICHCGFALGSQYSDIVVSELHDITVFKRINDRRTEGINIEMRELVMVETICLPLHLHLEKQLQIFRIVWFFGLLWMMDDHLNYTYKFPDAISIYCTKVNPSFTVLKWLLPQDVGTLLAWCGINLDCLSKVNRLYGWWVYDF